MNALIETNFKFKGQKSFYRGKVRDVYIIGDYVLMIATDRISAFDVVLPRAIPFKGQVLNQIAARNMELTRSIVPNWLITTPDPNVSIGIQCEAYPIEMVIRGYLAGHAWREYKSGKREICGIKLPEGMKENDKLPFPIITPTTKAISGHDRDISKNEIISSGLIGEKDYSKLEKYTLALFEEGTRTAEENGLILVDTKYEFGSFEDKVFLIDEIHTPDSSRYFYKEKYYDDQENELPQKQLSKEFVREWLINNGFQGEENQVIPEMSDEKVIEISDRYIELYEQFTGEHFERNFSDNISERIKNNVEAFLEKI